MSAAREAVIAEARTWLGTPFHWGARVKGVGVDCASFIAAVYEACGVFKAEDWGFFSRDWHLHTETEHYKFKLLRHALELPTGASPEPANIVLAKLGDSKVFSHGGIVVAWPEIICVHPSRGVVISSAESDPLWIGWESRFFNPFVKRSEAPDV